MLNPNKNSQKVEEIFIKKFIDFVNFDEIPDSIDDLSNLINSIYKFKHSVEIENFIYTLEAFKDTNEIDNEKINDFFNKTKETLEKYRNQNQGKGIHLLLQEKGYETVKKLDLEVISVDNKRVKKFPSSSEFLTINLNQLNSRYNKYGFKFQLMGDIVKIFEVRSYLMNDYPEIKEFLKNKFFMCFSNKNKWHIDKKGIKFLSSKVINLQRRIKTLEAKERIYSFIDLIAEFDLKMSLDNLFKNHPDFFESAAAINHHHAYKG